ncbi:YlbG family protein [Limosilactobacillus sp.]|jgi:uncharacterized protein YlbG (UPF0298 family)|uniref:YlbG family protein n=1 Tax=Limosilactobacillus sp. TaxID=2773925 RepID=UPI0025B8635F|nr:YlbG family protein [Limosilactobacillus sp.]MCI2031244.1 YlbG family protein [Limosilactobacillus sp.]
MFSLTKRRSIIVYYSSRRVLRNLHHYGQLRYASRRFHYAILYVNQDHYDEVKERLQHLRSVKHVASSARPDLDPTLTDLEQTGLYKQHDEDD